MAKIQLFTEYTHTPRLDPNICPEKVISHQGCMGYTCPVPNAQRSSTYHTCCTKCKFRQIYIDMSTNTTPQNIGGSICTTLPEVELLLYQDYI